MFYYFIYIYKLFMTYVSYFSIAGLDFLADGGADFEHAITVTGKNFIEDFKDSYSLYFIYIIVILEFY